jgi:hypothetical protein
MKRYPHTPPWAPAIALASTLASVATLAVAVALPAALACPEPRGTHVLAARHGAASAAAVKLDDARVVAPNKV